MRWVHPLLVGRIEYREFTGRLRHAAWKGLETAADPARRAPAAPALTIKRRATITGMSHAAAPTPDYALTARQFARPARLSPELVTLFITPTRSPAGPVHTRDHLPLAPTTHWQLARRRTTMLANGLAVAVGAALGAGVDHAITTSPTTATVTQTLTVSAAPAQLTTDSFQ